MATKKAKSTTAVNTATNVLENLMESLPKATPAPKGNIAKWRFDFSLIEETAFVRWIEAKTVSEPVLQRLEHTKDTLNQICLEKFAHKYFDQRNKPSNPQLASQKNGKDDHTASWIFTDKFKFRLPEVLDGQDAQTVYIDAFIEAGIHPIDAEKLVRQELILNPVIGIKPLNDLLNGHFGHGREFVQATEIEKSAGKKIAAFLSVKNTSSLELLTDDEKIAAIQRDSGVTVRPGFLDRVCSYAKSVADLMVIFRLISPVVYPSYSKFATNDTPVAQGDRKIQAAAEILGTSTEI